MPIIRSAKKALRSSARKRVFNLRRSRAMKSAVKDARAMAATGGKKGAEALAQAYKAVDKAARSGLIKKNAASRTKSRLAKALKKAAGK